ncbi:hypothetical protein ABG768_010170 [Culter alburnus]|uniref:ELYS-like domain-containing protein n=1 Tax=Culter alburnus TaxID=194366 RepID=A0AAW1ZIA9_CULAL
MFLDENSITLVHKLVLKLKNLLSLVHLAKKQRSKQGSRASCVWGCWKQDCHAMRQYILLGSLVQWWSITGLLPKYPEAHELKRISQMWREMDQKHRRTCLELSSYAEDKYRWSSLIQGMVAHLDKQHGPIWVSEDCAYQTYPPPSLKALLKLVLLPNIDMVSVQAIIMYFILDVTNFLQCKDDLLQSFCHVFSIPSAFSQQIVGFWLLDHGLVTDSMDVLLSPRACPPTLSWHHCAVLRTLLRTGENQAALKYLYRITPAMENIHDIKLCVDVLIQNKCISAAWALLRGLQTEDVHLFKHFIHVCERCGISSNLLATLGEGMAHLHLTESRNMQSDEAQILNQETIGQSPVRTEPGQSPRPLSAWLYLRDDSLTPGDFVKILRQSISEIYPLQYKRRIPQALCHVANSTSVDICHEFKKGAAEEEYEEDLPLQTEEEMYDTLPVFSSPSTSPDSMESVGFFTSACSSPSALCSEAPSAQEPIVLKQNSSSVLEDEDKTPADLIHGCPDLTITLEGATEALSINSLSRESFGEIVVSLIELFYMNVSIMI